MVVGSLGNVTQIRIILTLSYHGKETIVIPCEYCKGCPSLFNNSNIKVN